jgi:hypothetical protein
MPPEPVRADICALGLTLYYALTSTIPFHGGTAVMGTARPPSTTYWPTRAKRIRRFPSTSFAPRNDNRQKSRRPFCPLEDIIRDLQRVRENQPPLIERMLKGNSSVVRKGIQNSEFRSQ